MGNSDITKTDSNPNGIVVPPPIVVDVTPTTTSDTTESSSVSSISSSTSAPKSTSYDSDSGFPQLVAPEGDNLEKELAALERVYITKQREIARDILDKWLEGLREQAKRRLEELRSPAYAAFLHLHSVAFYADLQRKEERVEAEMALRKTPEYLSWVGTLNPRDQENQRQYDSTLSSLTSAIDAIGGYVERSRNGEVDPVNAVNLLAASYAIGTSVLGSVISIKELSIGAEMTASSFHEMWENMSPQMNPEQRPDILGQIGALFMVQLFAKATVETVGTAAAGKQSADNKNFCQEYAKMVIQLVKGGELDQTAGQMMSGKAQQPAQGVIALKLAFLSTALALLYKSEAGKITGDEFEAMLSGKIPLKEGDTKFALVSLIRSLLVQLPLEQREHLLDGLYNYMESNPKVEEKMGAAANLYAKLIAALPEGRPIGA